MNKKVKIGVMTMNEYDNIVKVEYNLKIKIKQSVEDKIKWLTHNYSDEISAFLTGDINENEIIIDGLLFPHQDVSSGSVEVEPKDLIKLRKEYGDECKRIIGHWHSHNTMGAFWSSTDDTFIKEYSITKDVCLFLVTSTSGKRLLVVNNKPFKVTLDNLEYEVLYEDKKMEETLKNIIETKVINKPTPVTTSPNHNSWEDRWGDYRHNEHNMGDYDKSDYEEDEETAQLKVKECLNWDKENKSVVVSGLTLIQADDILRRPLKEYNGLPTLEKDGYNYSIVYKIDKKTNLKEFLIEARGILEETFVIEASDRRALRNSTNEINEFEGYGY